MQKESRITRLCLSRRAGESLQLSIDGQFIATIQIDQIKTKRVYISIVAASDVLVSRTELTASLPPLSSEGI